MTIEQLKQTAEFLDELESALVNHGVVLADRLLIDVGGTFYEVNQVFDNSGDPDRAEWHLELKESR